MKLYSISDLHLAQPTNRQALEALPAYPEDWLILAGVSARPKRTSASRYRP
jgi:hypothetical protein